MQIQTIKVLFPCQENWDEMQSGVNGKFCGSCSKSVIDFTSFSKEEIITYLAEHRNNTLCGRFKREHVLIGCVLPAVLINSQSRISKFHTGSVFVMAMGALMLSVSTPLHSSPYSFFAEHGRRYNFQQDTRLLDDTSKVEKKSNVPEIITDCEMPFVTGDVDMETSDSHDTVSTILAEPRFKGGPDELLAFIKKNINYPEWEEKNNIQGVVYVGFTVDSNGKISQPKILRSVKGSKNFDREVIRIMMMMPDWIPAMDKNGNVAMQMIIPISFKLKTK